MIQKLIRPFPNNKDKKSLHAFINAASVGMLCLSMLVFGIGAFHARSDLHPFLMLILGILAGFVCYVLIFQIFKFLLWVISTIPRPIIVVFMTATATLVVAGSSVFSWPSRPFQIGSLITILLAAIISVSIALLRNDKVKGSFGLIISLIAIAFGLFWILKPGNDPYADDYEPFTFDDSVKSLASLGIANPTNLGTHQIKQLTYGSGNDVKRMEYGSNVDFTSETVDASLLLPEWKGKHKRWRENYWKFGVDSFPLNGRINMPVEDGKFPMVLVVHGNHNMNDYSDSGYEYLNSVLASKGIIAVSVDENFVNGHWSGDFRGNEMPVRAWLLLKHIEQFKKWNQTPGHILEGKVDMNNIMLIGHSRGGEAVSIAAAYNELNYFPDNALEKFDFHFQIKGLVSIAPTDYRYHRKVSFKNINYLSLQGSYDSDESSFWGFRPYQRLTFDDDNEHFKAAVFIHKANHGQFNSTWDRSDMGAPMKWLLNLEPILSREDQETSALVFISAFVEATLKSNRDYLPIFQNINLARGWLPENDYVTNFQSSNFKAISDFEEDINPTSAVDNNTISSKNLKIWREEELKTRDGGDQDNNAVVLGWNYGNKMEQDSIAEFTIHLKDTTSYEPQGLSVSLAMGNFDELKLEDEDRKESMDLTIKLKDRDGYLASYKLSDNKRVSPRLKVKYAKEKSLNKRYGESWEPQLESFHLSLDSFLYEDSFSRRQIIEINFFFDEANSGVLYLDDIGWH